MVKFRKGFAKFSIRIALSEKFLGEQFIMSIESVFDKSIRKIVQNNCIDV